MAINRRDFLTLGGTIAVAASVVPAMFVRMNETAIQSADDFKIVASKTSSENDFDFLVGNWSVKNRMLKSRLSKSNEWLEFDSTIDMHKILNGFGNIEAYKSMNNGKPFEGAAVRLFDPKTRLWSVYWTDTNTLAMDTNPVVGSFENGIGKLYAKDKFNDKPVVSLYQWDSRDPKHPIWSQALSDDAGKTWEWNWYMTLTRTAKK